MPKDLLDKGANWHSKRRNAKFTMLIKYEAPSETITISATVGDDDDTNAVDEVGSHIRFEGVPQDFMVRRADLIESNRPFEPAPGHKIIATVRGQERTFEVHATTNESASARVDPHGYDLRIHTTEVPTFF